MAASHPLGASLAADKPGSAPSSGFMKLRKAGRLDLTLEREILRPKWAELFTDAEREFCRRRLAEYGYRTEVRS